jgi:SNF2 family DNA or RNA helicase
VIEIVDDKALVLDVEDPNSVLTVIDKSSAIGGNKVAVKWGLKETKVLALLGYADTPSPMLRDYVWTGKYKPFAHQKVTSSFLSIRDKAFCFSEPGCGKTASVIWAADYLMKIGDVKRVLVVCPMSIMKAAWQQDLFTFAMHRSCSIAHGDSATRRKILAQGAEFVIINFDGMEVVKDELMRGGFDLMVVDEASGVKNAQTKRWKTMRDIAATIPKLWMMTGTPAAQSPLDAYGLAKLVNPKGTPKYFGAFRDQVMYKVTNFKWAAKTNAEDTVHKMLQPAIRFEKAQCLDLPPVIHVTREAPLTPQQTKYYKLLKQKLMITAGGETVTAVNAAVVINKLLQISGGAVYGDNGDVVEFDVSNRLNVILEAIEETEHKVLVFVPFTHTIELLRARLEKEGITCAVINGDVSLNKRTKIVTDFQNNPDPRVLIIQPQAASHGLTLTAANTVIWYAPVTSVETYLQANARIDRPGQKNNMTIVHIAGSDVEAKIYKMLQENLDNHQKLVDLYREEMK